MFKKIKISNYKTHVETTLELKDITLLIGSNNSGKTNLITGLNYFSKLVSSAFPESGKSKDLRRSNYFRYKHSLSNPDVPICFYCEWEKENKKVAYELQLYCMDDKYHNNTGCREKIIININSDSKTVSHGYEEPAYEMLLRTKLRSENLTGEETEITTGFFRSLSFLHYYNFQPSFLKGLSVPFIHGNIPEKKKLFR